MDEWRIDFNLNNINQYYLLRYQMKFEKERRRLLLDVGSKHKVIIVL